MKHRDIFLANDKLTRQAKEVKGDMVEFGNEKFYKIANADKMPDFFISVVSNSNHWMFISSNGSLSAGRINRNNALFPYYTDDKIHDYKGQTGSKTCFLVEKNKKTFYWEPFSNESETIYNITRNLYKSIYGNKIIFEETNLDLNTKFSYAWLNSEKFGWIKRSTVENTGNDSVRIEILDGIKNILPHGIDYYFQNEYSNLSDAYKKNELVPDSGLALYTLSSIPVDKAEPSESLKATTVWSCGAPASSKILISDEQVENFKLGLPVQTELNVRAKKGAYYICSDFTMGKNETREWSIIAEINQDSCGVANLNQYIKTGQRIEEFVYNDAKKGTRDLISIVGSADGIQMCNDELGSARHFSNTMFNIMRGGVFTNNYTIDRDDFELFVAQTNLNITDQIKGKLNQFPDQFSISWLVKWAEQQNDSDLERICYEYLPLTFSRRHGDPSRPWNQFSIETRNEDGSNKLNYEGNWRDIFQNWEALCLSFPEYTESIIAKFLNASTADGYNPYRITREGVDWETSDSDDPWSYIGYWGDHQIIYLQKLLELSTKYHPGKLENWLSRDIFAFADVPYKIKPFDEIVSNPKNTIDFDFDKNRKIEEYAARIGADGKLLKNRDDTICKANLTEKILVTLLAKLSNFIPEAGIWLNTQRPEWNDANNALVGNGVSMVTLYYLRRFLKFWEKSLEALNNEKVNISVEIRELLNSIFTIFINNQKYLEKEFSDESRYHFSRSLGIAGSNYRKAIYKHGFTGKREPTQVVYIKEFIQLSLRYIDHTIKNNKRSDGLYHSYNLISIGSNKFSVRNLYEMLEGQVAVLSSGYLSVKESLEVLDALKASKMYRKDQNSYILYPDRELPRFMDKNNIAEDQYQKSALLQKLIAKNNKSIIEKDKNNIYHFNGDFRNADVLAAALEKLDKDEFGSLVKGEKELILDIYERMFDHQSFTGRSGTFFGYEGLGSIYWHMVSKLLLAAQECFYAALEGKEDKASINRLKKHYYEIKAGIGLHKSPELYGAFPTDAYSHTPAGAGVKQPGLTGQVKEDIISRFGELGLQVINGEIVFNPSLIHPNEFLEQKEVFKYTDLKGNDQSIELRKKQLAFTFCQVPVFYTLSLENKILVYLNDGSKNEIRGDTLTADLSKKLFSRTGEIKYITYNIDPNNGF